MTSLPIDVVNHILSFLPCRDKFYDNCMEQIKYLVRTLDEYRQSNWKPTKTHYNNVAYHTFILRKNRLKMEYR